MTNPLIKIVAETQDEFKEIECAKNTFLEHFNLRGKGSVTMEASGAYDLCYFLRPEQEGCSIDSVSSLSEEPTGKIRHMSPSGVSLRIDNITYDIDYTSNKE